MLKPSEIFTSLLHYSRPAGEYEAGFRLSLSDAIQRSDFKTIGMYVVKAIDDYQATQFPLTGDEHHETLELPVNICWKTDRDGKIRACSWNIGNGIWLDITPMLDPDLIDAAQMDIDRKNHIALVEVDA